MMVVDLLHEFELGVWKTLFTHLIRILRAASERPGTLTDELNARYVQREDMECILIHETDSARSPHSVDTPSAAFTTTSQK
jgi:hypothetical protein